MELSIVQVAVTMHDIIIYLTKFSVNHFVMIPNELKVDLVGNAFNTCICKFFIMLVIRGTFVNISDVVVLKYNT